MPRLSLSSVAGALLPSAILATVTVATASLVMAALPAHAQTLTQQNISVAQAMAVVEGAIESCGRDGDLVTVTVAVVDRAGQPRVMVAADNSNPHNLDLARRKAYTALTFRRTSLNWVARTADGTPRAGQRQMVDVIALGGGVPIMIGDDPIGAVGVSGAPGGQPADDACAMAGVEAIADQLR
ncbi:MAG: heme-binding protein [Acidobacteria bacterium]|nr:heme-binding protein [Acidobacteriota bacterium]